MQNTSTKLGKLPLSVLEHHSSSSLTWSYVPTQLTMYDFLLLRNNVPQPGALQIELLTDTHAQAATGRASHSRGCSGLALQ